MSISKIFNRGEIVEGMIIENGGRSLQINGKLEKYGGILYDAFTGEGFAISAKPLIKYKKNKSVPVHLIDRDAGVTVSLKRIIGTQIQKLTLPDVKELIIDGKNFSGWTCTLERPECFYELVGMSKLIGAAVSSETIRQNFTPPMSGRERLLNICIGGIIGLIFGVMFL